VLSQFAFFPVSLSERSGQLTETESQNTRETANKADGGEVITPETLVRKYASAVLGICLAHTKNFHDSEDIMQDVFLKAVKKFDTLRHHGRARSWLLKITRRKCIDYYRNSQPTQKMPDDIAAPTDTMTEQISHLHEAISKLPSSNPTLKKVKGSVGRTSYSRLTITRVAAIQAQFSPVYRLPF